MAEVTDQAKQVTDQAGQKSQEVAGHATDQAKAVTETAKQQASVVADQALDHGRNMLGDLRSELGEHGDRQAGRASEALRGISSEFEQMVGASNGQGPAHDLVREAANRAGSLASRLDEGGVNGVLDDVQRFARRRPGLFLLAAAGTGFAVGRLARNTDLSRLKEAAKPDSEGTSSAGGSSSTSSGRELAGDSASENDLFPSSPIAPAAAPMPGGMGTPGGQTIPSGGGIGSPEVP